MRSDEQVLKQILDFAQNDEEFALKVHEVNINVPLSPVYVNLRNLLVGNLLTEEFQ